MQDVLKHHSLTVLTVFEISLRKGSIVSMQTVFTEGLTLSIESKQLTFQLTGNTNKILGVRCSFPFPCPLIVHVSPSCYSLKAPFPLV